MPLEGLSMIGAPAKKGDSHPHGDSGCQAHLEVKEGAPHSHGPCAIHHPWQLKVAVSHSL